MWRAPQPGVRFKCTLDATHIRVHRDNSPLKRHMFSLRRYLFIHQSHVRERMEKERTMRARKKERERALVYVPVLLVYTCACMDVCAVVYLYVYECIMRERVCVHVCIMNVYWNVCMYRYTCIYI